MTAIIGLQTKKDIYLASDTLITQGRLFKETVPTKIFRKKNFLIACCGECRGNDIIEHIFDPPKKPAKMAFRRYMYLYFIPALQETMQQVGYLTTSEGKDSCDSWFIIAAKDGRKKYLMHFEYNFGLRFIDVPFVCEGSGRGYCYGALHAQESLFENLECDEIIVNCILQTAVESAIKYSPSCGGEVMIEKL